MEYMENQSKSGIYKFTSPSERNYVGQAVDMFKRKHDYSKLRCKGQTLLYNSFMKYGFENHKYEILEEINEPDPKKLIEILDERELYWSKIHNACVDDGGLVLIVGGKHG